MGIHTQNNVGHGVFQHYIPPARQYALLIIGYHNTPESALVFLLELQHFFLGAVCRQSIHQNNLHQFMRIVLGTDLVKQGVHARLLVIGDDT